MMFDVILRELADRALNPDDRTWVSVDSVAAELGTPRSTTGRVMRKLLEIGAARRLAGSGEFELCTPERAVDIYKVRWDPSRNRVGYVTDETLARMVESREAVLGGSDAVAHHLGHDVVLNSSQRSAYVLGESPTLDGTDSDIPVYLWGGAGPLPHTGFASITQTIAELFSTPGWQADERYRAMYFTFIMPIQGDIETCAR